MALVPALCLLAGPAAWAGSTNSRVYRWVDEKGEVHYGDHVPMSGLDSDGKVRTTDKKTSPTPAAAPAAATKAAPDPKDPKDPKDAKAPADRAKP